MTFAEEDRYVFRLVNNLNVNELNDFLLHSPPINMTKLIDSTG
jgi:hypothetical protein